MGRVRQDPYAKKSFERLPTIPESRLLRAMREIEKANPDTLVLKNQRAEYGKQNLSTLSKELVTEFGNGYSEPNLSRMLRLMECFPSRQNVVTLSRLLSWSHFVEILPIKDELAREFYAEMCRLERWSVRTQQCESYGPHFFGRRSMKTQLPLSFLPQVAAKTKARSAQQHSLGLHRCVAQQRALQQLEQRGDSVAVLGIEKFVSVIMQASIASRFTHQARDVINLLFPAELALD